MDSIEMKKKLIEELMANLDDAESQKLKPVKEVNDTDEQTNALNAASIGNTPLDGMKNAKGLPSWAANEMGVENVKGDANLKALGGEEKPEGVEVEIEVGGEGDDKDMWEGLSNDEVRQLVRHYMKG